MCALSASKHVTRRCQGSSGFLDELETLVPNLALFTLQILISMILLVVSLVFIFLFCIEYKYMALDHHKDLCMYSQNVKQA